MKKLEIKFSYDDEMMSITDEEGNSLFHGNFWDFSNEPEYIGEFLKKIGVEVEMIDESTEN